MQKLKASELPLYRTNLLCEQQNRCALCGEIVIGLDAVVDHCHTTGEIRGVLHRGCNSMLGKIENHMRMAKLNTPAKMSKFLSGVVPYLYKREYTGMMYPTHRDEEAKRIRRNKLARKRRAAAKENSDAT